MQGIQGVPGPIGPQGPQGVQGLQGPQGLADSAGAQGAQGPTGLPARRSAGPLGRRVPPARPARSVLLAPPVLSVLPVPSDPPGLPARRGYSVLTVRRACRPHRPCGDDQSPAAVADTTDPGNTAAQLNALLASLRAAGLLAT